MKLNRFFLIALITLTTAALAHAESYKASLDGYQEVPAVSSSGTGELRLKVVNDATIEYELTYENLEGAVTAASHVHLGQAGVSGGVIFFLCGGPRPPCTPTSGYFTGIVTAADIVGPAAQGIAAGEFAEVLRALRAGVTYVNVHTDKHPSGEIRGQVK